MMFTCPECRQEVSCTKEVWPEVQRHEGICYSCYEIMVSKRYPVNVNGARTLFSPLGSGLGDQIMNSVIKRVYEKDNPDEEIIWTDGMIDGDIFVDKYHPDKFFWCKIDSLSKRPTKYKTFDFSPTIEAQKIADVLHVYPEWNEYDQFYDFTGQKFIVFHARNNDKCPEKNMGIFHYFKIVEQLTAAVKDKKIEFVVLVGNDHKFQDEILDKKIFYDMRKKLTLNQIAWVLKNAALFVGRDSGIAHLAGAAGTKGIAYKYINNGWMVKAPPGQFDCYLYSVDFETVQNKIGELICAI